MKKSPHPAAVLVSLLFLVCAASRADEGRHVRLPPEDPALAGEEFFEETELEKLLSTRLWKRRSSHFTLETDLDGRTCRELLLYCEKKRLDFLEWAGLPTGTKLWEGRAALAMICSKEAFYTIAVDWTKGLPDPAVERERCGFALWKPSPPTAILYCREGAGLCALRTELFHYLNHFFLHGMAGSGAEGTVWWLWEGFSVARSLEARGCYSWGCRIWETDGDGMTREGRRYYETGEWVEVLKAAAREGKDEPLARFMHNQFLRTSQRMLVKAWSLVRWLLRDEGEKARFLRFVSLLAKEQDQEKALEEVYGMTPEELDRAWRAWILEQPG